MLPYTFLASGELASLLGVFPSYSVKALLSTAHITIGFNTLYVYIDNFEHQVVRDYCVILRHYVRNRESNSVNISYGKPHCLPSMWK